MRLIIASVWVCKTLLYAVREVNKLRNIRKKLKKCINRKLRGNQKRNTKYESVQENDTKTEK